MSRRKTERQLNLVICLLATRRFLTAQQIRAMVAGYEDADSDAAFKRMFERDKKELRDSGIPVETGGGDLWADEEGYRISRSEYVLPEIALLPDEAAVLGLAARAWRHAALGGAATGALLKLRAAGVPIDTGDAPGVIPVLRPDEPAFLPVWQAVRDRRPIEFDYRKPDRSVSRREVEPWGVVNYRGRWYVAGYDRDRASRRVFRLGRVVGEVRTLTSGPPVVVPEGADVRSLVSGESAEPPRLAALRVRPDAGHALRRRALRIVPGARPEQGPGWDLVELAYSDLGRMVGRVAEFGAAVVVEDPPELRAAVLEHVRPVAERALPAEAAAAPAGPVEAAPARKGAASAEQLRRLLLLVPYAHGRDVRVGEVAEYFGLTEKQVLKDLSLLWMCGLPGYTPGDLIEVDLEAAEATGEIIIGNAETLAEPLRLTADEAATLVVGLELLGDMAGAADSDALKRAGEKLRSAAGSAVAELADSVRVRVDMSPQVRELQARAESALRSGQRVHLRYLSGYADAVTERDVDPMRLLVQDGEPFLEGWCRLRSDVRFFRLDRVLDLTVLPVAAEVPADARPRDLSDGVLQRSAADAEVVLLLAPEARWVSEEYVCSEVREEPDGRLRVTLRTPAPDWVRRLALRLGRHARVLSPAGLAERVRTDARRALAANEG
ncbi:transcriptional regulator [Murinocardiopsis flavida]|uniref:Transcriptional regulator n=1 Tax=Murinocardiopsis flavida TaxID=645275 RepID=A0A2P8DLI1_9ACTN|nr:WYL domain-containing protein [Murinocardiopsis flavida]PSK98065.1 transcriptional regulator [Murinocardiopsis flavida]